jgi:hypothetical protein
LFFSSTPNKTLSKRDRILETPQLGDVEKFQDSALAVDIVNVKGTAFIDAATAVETDAKQSAIALCL